MISETILIITAIILAFSSWNICLLHLYKQEHTRAEMMQEYIEIKRQIEKGNHADKIAWEYYNVAYLDNRYNIRAKGIMPKHKKLEGDKHD